MSYASPQACSNFIVHCVERKIPPFGISEISSLFFGCADWFVSDLVGNPKDRFSHNRAHELHHEKTCFLQIQKQRGRSAAP